MPIYSSLLFILLCFSTLCGETLNKDLNLNSWDRLFSMPKRACSGCDFVISFLTKDANIESLDEIIDSADFNTDDFSLAKAVFIKKGIDSSYEDFLRHKYVFRCMYCGSLDSVSNFLPSQNNVIVRNNIKYSFIPLQSGYKIEISDEICGVSDVLLFKAHDSTTELFVFSQFACKS